MLDPTRSFQGSRKSGSVSLKFGVRLAITTFFYFLISITASSAANMRAVEQISFVNIDKGFRSGVRERKFVVIETVNEWSELWNSHVSGSIPPKAPPSIDFQTEMIVAVFSGEKMTGGYDVEIIKIEEAHQTHVLSVTIRDSKPPPDALVSQALTQPFHIVKLKKVELAVTFVLE
jgi:PrcB C-terminal